ncbi:hypothetical protein [Mucilaginibacter sp. UYCu711]|uniref:hypothetical protein n=1 Tax=Mucilaginibacter sp. UYCu711 TaxID=3156339 RepID=UPI003D239E27
MLKDELKVLRKIAESIFNMPQKDFLRHVDANENLKNDIHDECQRIKDAWTSLLFSQNKDHVLKRYVWFEQETLLKLSDYIFYNIQSADLIGRLKKKDLLPEILSILLSDLLELKDFLIQYFHTYINPNGKLPEAAIPLIKKQLGDAAEELSALFTDAEIDSGLKACLLDYLHNILYDSSNSPLNYRVSEYQMLFTETLKEVMDFRDKRDLTYAVVEALFYLNFNHFGFSQWYQEKIVSKSSASKPLEIGKLVKDELLILKSLPVIITTGFDPLIAPINIQLEGWLIEYTKNDLHDHIVGTNGKFLKMELKVTVAQLVFLIRLLYEEGVFAMKSIAGVLRFFSNHFMTKKQAHISYGSMNKLYYSSDQFTAYYIRELLLNMVSKINKLYFPT